MIEPLLTAAELADRLGFASGDELLFQRRREEAAMGAEARRMAREITRLPQAESLVAAVMGDADLFDQLHERVRNMTLVDEYGRERQTTANDRILEPDHVATLFVIINLIVENGGREVRLTQHGAVPGKRPEGRLPFIEVKLLGQLRRNDWITTRREASDIIVGLGERVRAIANRWEIKLPQTT